jgi:hypothetical protein
VAKKKRKKPGPPPVIVKIDGNWVDALKRALHIKRPAEWPNDEVEKQRSERALESLEDEE